MVAPLRSALAAVLRPSRQARRRRFAAPAALLALLGLAAWSVPAWERRTRRTYPPRGRLVTLPGGPPLHVIEGGVAGGPPLLLIHGSDGVALDWPTSPLWAQLAGHWRLLAPDRLGHGYTPAGRAVTVAANASALAELLDTLALQAPVTVVGHSYGAAVALDLAARRPQQVRGLVLVSPLVYPEPGLTRPLARLMALRPVRLVVTRLLLLPLGRVVGEVEGRRAFAPAPLPDPWRRMMLAFSLRPPQVQALAEENRTLARELSVLAPQYPQVRCPVTLLAGDGDRLCTAARQAVPLARALPQAHLHMLAGGHQLHWTHPAEVAATIRALPEPDAPAP